MAKQDTDNTTHFGYQSVAADEKAGLVKDVFDSVASRSTRLLYDRAT